VTTTSTPSRPPLSAGAVPELPVVDQWEWLPQASPPTRPEGFEEVEPVSIGAQATIALQAAEIERLTRERDEALQKVALAKTVCDEYMKRHDELAVRFDDLDAELESLKAKQVAEADEVMRLAEAFAQASSDLDESIRSRSRTPRMVNRHDLRVHVAYKAAREALRAFLTKDCT
jgi:hypothetical protein